MIKDTLSLSIIFFIEISRTMKHINKQLSQRQYEELIERLLTFSIEDLRAAVASMRGREQ